MNEYRFYRIFSFLLVPFSYLYYLAFSVYRIVHTLGMVPVHEFQTNVISIGNISVGGTGKTPFVIFLVNLLKKHERKTVIVTRGYGRVSKEQIIDLSTGDALDVGGDEPWLITQRTSVPVVVTRKKYKGCRYALDTYKPDVVILDDGFQSFGLARDLDIVLLDATDNLKNAFLLPAGKLREPIGAIQRANIVVITRCNQVIKQKVEELIRAVQSVNRAIPIFVSFHDTLSLLTVPEGNPVNNEALKDTRILAIASLGNNRSFFSTLSTLGLNVVHRIGFLDHHRYCEGDVRKINRLVARHSVDAIVTTEKDLYTLRSFCTDMHVPLYALQIQLSLHEVSRFSKLLVEKGIL